MTKSPQESNSQSHLLVVEDDLPTQQFMKAVLRKNYTIHCAASADEARTMLNQHPIQLILMDLSIQGKENGLQFTKSLRNGSRWNNLPIIALTAHAFQRDRDNALEAGCSTFITKPFNLNELLMSSSSKCDT